MLDKKLLEEAKTSKILLFITIGVGLVISVLVVLQASYLARIVSGVFLKGQDLNSVWPFLSTLLLIIIIKAFLVWLEEIMASLAAAQIKKSLRQRLLAHLFSLGPTFVRGEQTGSLVNLLTEGIQTLENYFARYLPQLARVVLIPLLILIFIFPQDLLSGLILLFTAPLIPIFMILIGKWAQFIANKQWDVLSRMNGHFADVLQGLTTLKILGRSKVQGEIIALVSNRFRETTLKVLRVAFISALTLELAATLSTAVLAVSLGLRLVYAGIAFEQALFILLLAPEFYLPFRLLGSQYHEGLNAVSAAKDMFTILDQQTTDVDQGQSFVLPPGEKINIAFQDVHYCYDNGSRPALQGVSFDIAFGEHTALVGESGGGKSTIADLLLGFIRPSKGQILINGISLEDISLNDWRRNVAYVPQHPYILSGTIRENISLGKPEAAYAEIEKAAELAGIQQFIQTLPQGYETPVGEGGIGLSGGEAQRIAIARAFLHNRPILILDEATKGLDPQKEMEIDCSLAQLMKGRTVLTIAHNLMTANKANRILVVEQGRIIETGSPTDLLEKQGIYHRLVRARGGLG